MTCGRRVARRILALAMMVFGAQIIDARDWELGSPHLKTRWTESVNPSNVLPEYPRPQMVRKHWQNLNGLWQYAITAKDALPPARWGGLILVPYPIESALSGVQKALQPNQNLWYHRTIEVKPAGAGGRTLLHFGAVDYEATVYLNGKEVGHHAGGYQAFTIDLTESLEPGDDDLMVRVYDPTDTGPNPHGKQSLHPASDFFNSTSGIWQTVWLESVPETYVESIASTPDLDRNALDVKVNLQGNRDGITVEAIARSGATVVAKAIVNGPTALAISKPHLWSPDDPYLYDLEVRLLKDGKIVDDVVSYFGLRKIEVKKDAAGIERIFLNNRYTFNLGVLDQGFWPDGLYTAPTDAALKFDIQAVKAMGFNTIRKHVKIEPERWYFYCDKLGVLVWQDMVNPSDSTSEARTEFEREVNENIKQLYNHPSITTWVLFNEDFGIPYSKERLAAWIKQLDSTRLLDGHSGPFDLERIGQWARRLEPSRLSMESSDTVADAKLGEEVQDLQGAEPERWASDMTDLHHYPDPRLPPARPGKARVLTEFGGLGVYIEGHEWRDYPGSWFLRLTPEISPAEMPGAYAHIMHEVKESERQGLTAAIYTEIVDVASEEGGLMTYDRDVIKLPPAEIAQINGQLVPSAANNAIAEQKLRIAGPDRTPEAQRYAKLREQYQSGKRDLPFLRHLTSMALRQKDWPTASEAGNEAVVRLAQPYTEESWRFIQATTRTSADNGFEILRKRAGEADAVLGEYSAESKVREVIWREELVRRLAEKSRAPDWPAIQKAVAEKYGSLGIAEVYGEAMMYFAGKHEWEEFAKYYVLYFDRAIGQTEYPLTNLSYLIFEYVSDSHAIEVAARLMKDGIGTGPFSFGKEDPVDIDTYANLLHKTGRTQEAVRWEEKALLLSNGQDQDIVAHFQKMKAGHPTW